MDWQTELRPLIGKEKTAAGPVDVDHKIWRVVVRLDRGPTQVGLLPYDGDKVLWMSPVLEKGGMYLAERQREEINADALRIADGIRNPQPTVTE